MCCCFPTCAPKPEKRGQRWSSAAFWKLHQLTVAGSWQWGVRRLPRVTRCRLETFDFSASHANFQTIARDRQSTVFTRESRRIVLVYWTGSGVMTPSVLGDENIACEHRH